MKQRISVKGSRKVMAFERALRNRPTSLSAQAKARKALRAYIAELEAPRHAARERAKLVQDMKLAREAMESFARTVQATMHRNPAQSNEIAHKITEQMGGIAGKARQDKENRK